MTILSILTQDYVQVSDNNKFAIVSLSPQQNTPAFRVACLEAMDTEGYDAVSSHKLGSQVEIWYKQREGGGLL